MIIAGMSAELSQLRLTDWGVIRAQGADAASFLHGQLTQDFALLDRDHARLAGFCTAECGGGATSSPGRSADGSAGLTGIVASANAGGVTAGTRQGRVHIYLM